MCPRNPTNHNNESCFGIPGSVFGSYEFFVRYVDTFSAFWICNIWYVTYRTMDCKKNQKNFRVPARPGKSWFFEINFLMVLKWKLKSGGVECVVKIWGEAKNFTGFAHKITTHLKTRRWLADTFASRTLISQNQSRFTACHARSLCILFIDIVHPVHFLGLAILLPESSPKTRIFHPILDIKPQQTES